MIWALLPSLICNVLSKVREVLRSCTTNCWIIWQQPPTGTEKDVWHENRRNLLRPPRLLHRMPMVSSSYILLEGNSCNWTGNISNHQDWLCSFLFLSFSTAYLRTYCYHLVMAKSYSFISSFYLSKFNTTKVAPQASHPLYGSQGILIEASTRPIMGQTRVDTCIRYLATSFREQWLVADLSQTIFQEFVIFSGKEKNAFWTKRNQLAGFLLCRENT